MNCSEYKAAMIDNVYVEAVLVVQEMLPQLFFLVRRFQCLLGSRDNPPSKEGQDDSASNAARCTALPAGFHLFSGNVHDFSLLLELFIKH
jgi:hypothetical protein